MRMRLKAPWNATTLRRCVGCAAVIVGLMFGGQLQAAPLLNVGDSIQAEIFTGTQGTSDGNPNPDGQGWYQGNSLTTKLNYYAADADLDYARWANKIAGGSYPSYLSYFKAYEGANAGQILLSDAHNGQGIGWLYTAAVDGDYELSFDAFSSSSGAGNIMRFDFGIFRADHMWESFELLSGNDSAGGTYTGMLHAGDAIGVTMRNNRAYFASVNGSITNLRVTLIPEPATFTFAACGCSIFLFRRARKI